MTRTPFQALQQQQQQQAAQQQQMLAMRQRQVPMGGPGGIPSSPVHQHGPGNMDYLQKINLHQGNSKPHMIHLRQFGPASMDHLWPTKLHQGNTYLHITQQQPNLT